MPQQRLAEAVAARFVLLLLQLFASWRQPRSRGIALLGGRHGSHAAGQLELPQVPACVATETRQVSTPRLARALVAAC